MIISNPPTIPGQEMTTLTYLGNNKAIHLTHWGWVTHICVSELTVIGSDNGLSPGRRQAIIWTNAGILLIRTIGTNFSEILGKIHSFSFSKMYLKMASAKWRLFGLGLNELAHVHDIEYGCHLIGSVPIHRHFLCWRLGFFVDFSCVLQIECKQILRMR